MSDLIWSRIRFKILYNGITGHPKKLEATSLGSRSGRTTSPAGAARETAAVI